MNLHRSRVVIDSDDDEPPKFRTAVEASGYFLCSLVPNSASSLVGNNYDEDDSVQVTDPRYSWQYNGNTSS